MITPNKINLSKDKKTLTVRFESLDYSFTSEFLRIHSPSAEVLGHGPGQEILQLDKENVVITKIRPIGNYAIALDYSDRHTTGIYSWEYLHFLAINKERLWQEYKEKVTNQKNK